MVVHVLGTWNGFFHGAICEQGLNGVRDQA